MDNFSVSDHFDLFLCAMEDIQQHMLSYIGSVSAIMSASGQVFWGFVFDRSTYKMTLTIMTGFDGVLLISWPFLNVFTDDSLSWTTALAFVWLGGMFFFQAGIYNVMIGQLARAFDASKVGYNYTLISNFFSMISPYSQII